MSAQAFTISSTTGSSSAATNINFQPQQPQQPYILYAISDRPPGSSSTSGGSSGVGGGATTGGGAHGRDPIQVICPYTGSNVTNVHPLRVPTSSSSSSSKSGSFGVKCLVPVPCTTLLGGGGDDVNTTVFVGHGGTVGGNKDDHAFLVSGQSTSSSSNVGSSGIGGTDGAGSSSSLSGSNPRWKVRLPVTLSSTPQSMAVSPDGRYLVAGSTTGTCYLWEWACGDEDNLIKVWKAHYRSVSCVAFDKDDGATIFTAGEDGVVNAWCFIDLIDVDNNHHGSGTSGSSTVHPFQTWSEHHLPVTSLCVLPGSGRGSTRLVSSSLDRSLIIMELGGNTNNSSHVDSNDVGGGARTLARMCLPSGLHTVITDSSAGRLYGGCADGNIYCVDLCKHALHSTLEGAAGTFVNVNQSGSDVYVSQGVSTSDAMGDLLSGMHVLPASATPGPAIDQTKYISVLRGHVKAVTSLALIDPSNLASISSGGTALLASGSNDGTLRIWDLHSRSCLKVLRPWSPSSEGLNITSPTSATASPPIVAIVAASKSSLTSHGSTLALSVTAPTSRISSGGGRKKHTSGDLASLFKPLKRFVRGTSLVRHGDDDEVLLPSLCAPILWPRRDELSVHYWDDNAWNDSSMRRKRARSLQAEESESATTDKIEIARLQKALAESQTIIERWQTVNNQLVSKLKANAST
ncbi:hypothetical protein ACHAWU_008294 [Discostella pseudostelligera]|uniref:Uncharacterized protein n=1 Tax=Discostella pseudostelligera TaxID=259834 RepID=A0ABD3M3C2_9STRA